MCPPVLCPPTHTPQGKQAGEGLVWMGAQLARPGSTRANVLAAASATQTVADTSARLADAVAQARELHARAAQLRAAMDEVGWHGLGLSMRELQGQVGAGTSRTVLVTCSFRTPHVCPLNCLPPRRPMHVVLSNCTFLLPPCRRSAPSWRRSARSAACCSSGWRLQSRPWRAPGPPNRRQQRQWPLCLRQRGLC